MSKVLRPVKEGFFGVFRHFALALSSIYSVTITLLLMAVFIFLSVNIDYMTTRLEQSVQIHVQIEREVEDETQVQQLGEQIRSIPSVLEVVFSDKHTELEEFIANEGEEAETLYGEYRGENNPMLDAYLVTTVDGISIRTVAAQIEQMEGIYRVTYGGESTTTFLSSMENVRNFGFVIVLMIGFIAIFLISNTIRATIHSRRKEISIMRTVGASNGYIRWPFLVEGMIIGFLGSIVPVIVAVLFYRYIYNVTGGYLISQMFQLVAVYPLVLEISVVIMIIGIVVGATGSMFAVGKHLRWKR